MKKIATTLSLFFIFILVHAQSPSFQWAKQLGGGSADWGWGSAIATDVSGNVYTTGFFVGTLDFDPGAGTFFMTADSSGDIQEGNIYISKLDGNGNFIWAKRVSGTYFGQGASIVVDPAGYIYTSGFFRGTADFDPGTGILNFSSAPGIEDMFLEKLDTAGNLIWADNVGGTGGAFGVTLALDPGGTIYLGGSFTETVDFDPGAGTANLTSIYGYDPFISKYDPSGNLMWAKMFGGAYADDVCNSIAVDATGNVYMTGNYLGAADFDPDPINTFNITAVGFSQDTYITKLDALGTFIWAKSIGGATSYDNSASIKLDDAGNIYTTGYFEGPVDFDPDTTSAFYLTADTAGSMDQFILKLDTYGNFVWAKDIGGNTISDFALPSALALDATGNIYTTGYFGGTVDFDPNAGTSPLTNISGGEPNIYISKLNASGNFVWAGYLGGTSTAGVAFAITAGPSGDVYTTGEFSGTCDFDPASGVANLITPGEDVFIQKTSTPTYVWPGDADNNSIADNNDLLPIGLFYGQTGIARDGISNVWQADSSADWSLAEINGANIKHADCNGDAVVDDNDTLAVNMNFAMTHAFAPVSNEVRMAAPDLYFQTGSSSYASGSIVDVQVWAGTSAQPVGNLYGIVFNINYDPSLVVPASESISYSAGWLGTPGTNMITIRKVDALASAAYGGTTRTDHVNASGFGMIAHFKFQLKPSIAPNTPMTFSLSGFKADKADGTSVMFNTLPYSIVINSTAGIAEKNNFNNVSVYPNPGNSFVTVSSTDLLKSATIKLINLIGETIFEEKNVSGTNYSLDVSKQTSGIYFVETNNGGVISRVKFVKE